MRNPLTLAVGLVVGYLLCLASLSVYSQKKDDQRKGATADAVAEAQAGAVADSDRPEAKKNAHDNSEVFSASSTPPSSTALAKQPEKGQLQGFDFRRDPLNSMKPMMTLAEIMRDDVAAKPKVMALQRKLLAARYNLKPKTHPSARMSRGKAVLVGPTANLAEGVTWDKLASMEPADVKKEGLFPYPPLPPGPFPSRHWKNGGCWVMEVSPIPGEAR